MQLTLVSTATSHKLEKYKILELCQKKCPETQKQEIETFYVEP